MLQALLLVETSIFTSRNRTSSLQAREAMRYLIAAAVLGLAGSARAEPWNGNRLSYSNPQARAGDPAHQQLRRHPDQPDTADMVPTALSH